MTNRSPLRQLIIVLAAVAALLGGTVVTTTPAVARAATVTNTAHLDYLLDGVRPVGTAAHTTYRLADEPRLTMPWTYADARAGGTFERLGGGRLIPGTTDYEQGAYNADDVARAAVVYVRHWRQFGDAASRQKAYEMLRSITYLQTATGANRGNVVLWMQTDGTLNPSAFPKELPDPSDSGPSYWQARTLWALGEGYAAFVDQDPEFASFLQARLQLALGAVERQSLSKYGRYRTSDGLRVPAWLIVNGADVTAEATLGLSAYVQAAPDDGAARVALRQLLEGVAAMATDRGRWPYGAILPWAESRSLWHAWSSQPAGALARGAVALDQPRFLRPAITEAVSFDTTLITADGPDNAWLPGPIDKTQIAYGVDSRVQNLLTTSDAAGLPGLGSLAAMNASWFFGANRAGAAMYNPVTGIAYDGLAADGTVNRNSGAESTIHGLLTMLALDAHPAVRARAVGWRTTPDRAGLVSVAAESASVTTGTMFKITPAWTGESEYEGGAFLRLQSGQTAQLDLPGSGQARTLEPVSWLAEGSVAKSRWRSESGPLGTLRHAAGAQGISPASGVLLPQPLTRRIGADVDAVTVRATRGPVDLDAVLVRPEISRATFGTGGNRTELLASIARSRRTVRTAINRPAVAERYDRRGRLAGRRAVQGSSPVWVEPGGFTVVTTR